MRATTCSPGGGGGATASSTAARTRGTRWWAQNRDPRASSARRPTRPDHHQAVSVDGWMRMTASSHTPAAAAHTRACAGSTSAHSEASFVARCLRALTVRRIRSAAHVPAPVARASTRACVPETAAARAATTPAASTRPPTFHG
ncbi:hypothetical protein ADL05_08080 [Nocardiopsis sp. NRRL B-16309]|nr:hypothetical protein ADL05_08080 [Nocardiopsis sp. NRRL B-16309]